MSQLQTKLIKFKLDSPSDVWDQEYTTYKVIPSSTRSLPSKALVLFSDLIGFQNNLKVLDAGCGIGRNSVYLAEKGCEVHAVDFSKAALSKLDNLSKHAGVRERITLYNHSLVESFPFESNSFDLILDSYVFCHFVDEGLKQYYRDELNRVTKPGGIVFSSLFSVDDEYYEELINQGNGRNKIVTDPHNGVTKQLYTEKEIKTFFSSLFTILYFVKFQFTDIVLGKPYERSILALILQKRL